MKTINSLINLWAELTLFARALIIITMPLWIYIFMILLISQIVVDFLYSSTFIKLLFK